MRTIRMLFTAAIFMTHAVHGEGKFHPSNSQAAYGHFLVRLSDDVPDEQTDAIANQLAKTYGGRLEPFAAQGFHGFAIVLSPSRARLLSNDPRVIRVDEQQTSEAVPTVASHAAPSATPVRHAAPLLHAVDNGSGSWTSGLFTYDAAGNIAVIGDDHYAYDTAGRLVSGTAKGSGNRQDYSYDSFGNRLSSVTFGAPCLDQPCGGAVLIDWTTNRITDHAANYDTAGNLTSYDPVWEPLNTPQPFHYAYDAAGMISSTTTPAISPLPGRTFEYVYTANDERIAFSTGDGTWRVTLRDLGGKVIREMTAYVPSSGTPTWGWDRDHIFRDGSILATVSALGTEQFHLDHLGTPHLVTNASGGKTGLHVYYPFGEELNISQTEYPAERLKFTGHERDGAAVGGLDYMHARYYEGAEGRFLSVDPVLKVRAAMLSPQMWNRYSYVANNPLRYVDPTGTVAALPSNCADQKKTCKELQDLRNTVPIELRMFVRTRQVDGKTVVDSRYLNMKRDAVSSNFQTLRMVSNSPGVVTINTSSTTYTSRESNGTISEHALGYTSMEGIIGITLIPGERADGRTGTAVYVGADLEDRMAAGALAHELVHALGQILGIGGGHEFLLGGFRRDPFGPINVLANAAFQAACQCPDVHEPQ